MSLCVAGLYAGPWFVGSVFKASSERSVPSGISAVMWERYVPSASSRLSLTLSVLLKRDQKIVPERGKESMRSASWLVSE